MKPPRIEQLNPKKLIGMHMTMSLAENKTAALWRSFMPRRNEVVGRTSTDYISMQVYGASLASPFSPTTMFEKWAVVEVESFDNIPEGMEAYSLSGGEYAVFIHEGPAHRAPQTMGYIFGKWIPESDYEVDEREHFEVLPEGYDPLDENAREEVWIPIKSRSGTDDRHIDQ